MPSPSLEAPEWDRLEHFAASPRGGFSAPPPPAIAMAPSERPRVVLTPREHRQRDEGAHAVAARAPSPPQTAPPPTVHPKPPARRARPQPPLPPLTAPHNMLTIPEPSDTLPIFLLRPPTAFMGVAPPLTPAAPLATANLASLVRLGTAGPALGRPATRVSLETVYTARLADELLVAAQSEERAYVHLGGSLSARRPASCSEKAAAFGAAMGAASLMSGAYEALSKDPFAGWPSQVDACGDFGERRALFRESIALRLATADPDAPRPHLETATRRKAPPATAGGLAAAPTAPRRAPVPKPMPKEASSLPERGGSQLQRRLQQTAQVLCIESRPPTTAAGMQITATSATCELVESSLSATPDSTPARNRPAPVRVARHQWRARLPGPGGQRHNL